MTSARRIAIAILLTTAACGKRGEPARGQGAGTGAGTDAATAPAADRWKPIPRPAVSAACAKARRWFGYAATCVEQPLPALTTAAGTVRRLWSSSDPTRQWVYALTPPTGDEEVAEANGFSDGILGRITRRLELAATPPELLARLYAELYLQAAVVRCTADDAAPPVAPCPAPHIVTTDDGPVLRFVVEQYPHPALLARDRHAVWTFDVRVLATELTSASGRQLAVLDAAAPLPPLAPPLPELTIPPDNVAAPVAAPAEVETAVCAAAVELLQWRGRTCKVFGYPSIALPTGAIYFVANDAGERHLMAVRKPDGTIALSRAGGFESPLTPLVAQYDPAVVPPATFLAAYLLLDGKPARILCLPGSGDVLPDAPCPAPTAERRDDGLVIRAVLEELGVARGLIGDSDPAVRSIEWEFSPAGGMGGGGTRLIDLRAP